MKDWLRRRLIDPVLALLRQGISPDRLALSLAAGSIVGIFPVLGVSTIACTLLAIPLRLNLPAIQLVNYLMSPVQLLLIIPFVRVGERLTGAPRQPLSIRGGLDLIASDAGRAIVMLWDAIVHAAIAWAVLGPPLIWLLYRLLRPVLERAAATIASRTRTS
jgi:uncharacterized protein (DUF2062 family)